MPKIINPAMRAHLDEETTRLAAVWRITRKDGQQFFFTDHDRDVVFGGDTYRVACGVAVRKLDAQGKPVVDDDGQPVMVPKYGPHASRHFTASWLIEQGFGPKRIVGIMGHADIQMTFNLYGHLFELNESDHERLAAGELVLVGG